MRYRFIIAWALAASALFPTAAAGADRVYWAVYNPDEKIAFANLDGSGGADLNTSGATVDDPIGIAIDLAGNRVFWANSNAANSGISFASLDGSGGGNLVISGATVSAPHGLSIDPVAGRLYWANNIGGKISSANLDGSGGFDINTVGATTSSPWGIAVDPLGGRVYWANSGGGGLSFANLDGSGGGDLGTAGSPIGIAVDHDAGRVYWSASTLFFAGLDGSGVTPVSTGGATVSDPYSVAVDPDAGRLWWSSESTEMSGPGFISFTNLDGSGAADLNTAGATTSVVESIALIKSPVGSGVPTIAGGSALGSVLSCSEGVWAPDLVGTHTYRAPQNLAHQWIRDGAEIEGATGTSFTAERAGSYRCEVSASNVAGATTQTSGPHAIVSTLGEQTFGEQTLVSLALAAKRVRARGPIKVRVESANDFVVVGELRGRTTKKVKVSGRRRLKLGPTTFSVAARSRKSVKLAISKPVRKLFRRKGTLKLKLTAQVSDPSGQTRRVARKVTAKLKPRG